MNLYLVHVAIPDTDTNPIAMTAESGMEIASIIAVVVPEATAVAIADLGPIEDEEDDPAFLSCASYFSNPDGSPMDCDCPEPYVTA